MRTKNWRQKGLTIVSTTRIVASVWPDESVPADHAEAMEDARLMANAPKLLEAIKELLTVGRSVIDARPECDWDRYSALLNRIEGPK